MNIEILEVEAIPYKRWWESDKNKNRWQQIGNQQFRYRVTLKLKIDGKVVEVYKDTKNVRMINEQYDYYDQLFAESIINEVKKKREE